MSNSLRHMKTEQRNAAIQRRFAHGNVKNKAERIRGLGYWAAIDAMYRQKYGYPERKK